MAWPRAVRPDAPRRRQQRFCIITSGNKKSLSRVLEAPMRRSAPRNAGSNLDHLDPPARSIADRLPGTISSATRIPGAARPETWLRRGISNRLDQAIDHSPFSEMIRTVVTRASQRRFRRRGRSGALYISHRGTASSISSNHATLRDLSAATSGGQGAKDDASPMVARCWRPTGKSDRLFGQRQSGEVRIRQRHRRQAQRGRFISGRTIVSTLVVIPRVRA